MNRDQELERLAKLHAEGALTDTEFADAKRRLLSAEGKPTQAVRGIRRQSSRQFFGMPLWSIAIGPDLERGEMRGHARGIFALGDIATGFVALGGLARGFVAFGGVAVGAIAFGGCAIGILLAIGGAALGGIALGGAAAGVVAVGGGAFGYYALGGGATGVHSISAAHQDPAAVEFFSRCCPWFAELIER